MSVLIKDMEMPKSCSECDIKVRCFTDVKNIEWLTYHPAYYEERLTNCPLVPVPPHGDLIDRDALGISLERLAADKWNKKAAPVNWSYAFEECLEMVDDAPTIIQHNFINAPTIIEAEEGET